MAEIARSVNPSRLPRPPFSSTMRLMKATRFRVGERSMDQATGTVSFVYMVEFEDGASETFTERMTLDDGLRTALPDAGPAGDACLRAIHIAAGMSYWKMHCAPSIIADGMTADEAAFWNDIYTKGLGEFFYQNQIDFRGLVDLSTDPEAPAPTPGTVPTTDRVIANVGGGKDSIVAIELLKGSSMDGDAFTLNTSDVQERVEQIIGWPVRRITRTLDPEMVRRSKAGEVLNGHVPITLLYTLTATLVAILTRSKYVVLANERSANVGNVEYLGAQINHQWSKSEEAEKMIQDHVRTFITPDVVPFSLLRPMSELEVLRRFAEHPAYFHAFSSCNRNFAIEKPLPQREGHAYWCGSCPKCAFVFAGLAAFLPKATVVDIFGKDLFADPDLLPLYRELLGIKDFKPFECVGAPEETIVAFERAHANGAYEEDASMRMYLDEARPDENALNALDTEAFRLGDTSLLPEPFRPLYEAR